MQHSVSAIDTRGGSGIDAATYQVDGGPPADFQNADAVGHGVHAFTARARDRAGLQTLATESLPVTVDLQAPVPRIATPAPQAILLTGHSTLRYDVSDVLTPKSKVSVLVYDELGTFVRRLDVSGHAGDPYVADAPGAVVWDGRRSTGAAVLPGLYHYRVQATDQAGNTAISTESAGFLVLVLL